MPLKLHRGINSGATLRVENNNWSSKSIEGAFTIVPSNIRQNKVSLEGSHFHRNLCYSIGKKKRWLLAEVLHEHLEDPNGPFYELGVELVEGRGNCSQSREVRSVTFKEWGLDQPVRKLCARSSRAYLNRRSVDFESQLEKDYITVDFLQASNWADMRITKRQKRIPHRVKLRWEPLARQGRSVECRQHVNDAFEVGMMLQQEIEEEEHEEVKMEEQETGCRAKGMQLSDWFMPAGSVRSKRCRRVRDKPQIVNHKGHKVFERLTPTEPTEEEEEVMVRLKDDPITLTPLRVAFLREELRPAHLKATFGTNYAEGDSEPRLFALRLPMETVAFLIFEEQPSPDAQLQFCDVFLNADLDLEAAEVERLVLDIQSDGGLNEFVATCSNHVTHKLAGRFAERDGISIVGFSKRPQPLCLSRPQPLDCSPLCWPPSPQEENEEKEEEDEEKEEKEEEATCALCFEDLSSGCRLLKCRHIFCNACWQRHIVYALRQALPSLRCPAMRCHHRLGAVTALRFASLPLLMPHWRLLESSQMARDPRMALCPNSMTNCGRVVRMARPPGPGQAFTVRCSCGHEFCFNCRQESHWPASCKMYRGFKKKVDGLGHLLHSPSAVMVKGKPCPDCKAFIEKNGGCPSVVCPCGCNFCWQCSRPYKGYANHSGCYQSHLAKQRPADLQNITLSSIVSPSPSRSRRFCNALQRRLKRQFGYHARLSQRHVKAALYKDAADLARMQDVLEDAEQIQHGFMEMQRVVEFSLVAAATIRRSHIEQRNALLQTADRLDDLVAWMLDVVSGERCSVHRTTGEQLRWALEQAKTEVRFLQRLRVWKSPEAIAI